MYIDIASCHHAATKGHMNSGWKEIATRAMVGITFMSQANSRPGPWVYFDKKTLEDVIAKKQNYWVSHHGVKNVKSKGARGSFSMNKLLE